MTFNEFCREYALFGMHLLDAATAFRHLAFAISNDQKLWEVQTLT